MTFFAPCIPPTTTAQNKRLVMVKGKPRFFKSEAQNDATAIYTRALIKHRPRTPLDGPLRLSIEIVWPFRASDLSTIAKRQYCASVGRIPHTEKPDADNAAKALIDTMSELGFFVDDKTICHLAVDKFWGKESGISICLEPV